MKITDKTIIECTDFRLLLEQQIEDFEKRTGGKITNIGVAYTPDLTIHQFDVEFDRVVIRAGGRLPF